MISEKIVVIDDNPRVMKSLKLFLKEYDIIEFLDSRKAVSFFERPRDIHLVLLDVMMPGMDGLSVLEEIRKNNKDIAIIIMTAYGNKDVVVQALRSKANDFIEKPFDIKELKEKIRGFLKERFYFNKDAASVNYKVDRIKNFIKRNYQEVSLDIISHEMCLSPKYVSRMFKEKAGISYRDYHLYVKMDEAKALLRNTSFNVDEISYKLGYQNPESFMRIFKRHTKLTPMEYRLKTRKKGKRAKR